MVNSEEFPHVEVTREEFVGLLVQEGKTPEEARIQAVAANAFGSQIVIGKQWVSIKRQPPIPAPETKTPRME